MSLTISFEYLFLNILENAFNAEYNLILSIIVRTVIVTFLILFITFLILCLFCCDQLRPIWIRRNTRVNWKISAGKYSGNYQRYETETSKQNKIKDRGSFSSYLLSDCTAS
jgi:hypothetical protein